MKQKKNIKNPYATLQGGQIRAPHSQEGQPKATATKGNDLRAKR